MLLVDEAKKLYRLAIEVVETTPFTLEVTTLLAYDRVLLVIILEVAVTPLIDEVRVLTAASKLLVLIKEAVVVEG